MDPLAVDQIRLNFSPKVLTALNGVIGLMMYGMALDIHLADFRKVFQTPKAPLIGLGAQFLLLPTFTFLLTLVLPVTPSMALGMLLVASCPGGNLSNILTYLAGGNVALSVTMTAVSTAAAVVMTPLNLALWGSLHPTASSILEAVRLSPWNVFQTIVLILGLPLFLGLLTAKAYPGLANRVRTPFKLFSVAVFVSFVGLALLGNWQNFLTAIGVVAFGVAVHNGLALSLGYGAARFVGLRVRDRRAVSIEVGIQNSALGLVLIFQFFQGLGGMAIIAAWWGVWHIVSGLCVAGVWAYLPPKEPIGEVPIE